MVVLGKVVGAVVVIDERRGRTARFELPLLPPHAVIAMAAIAKRATALVR